MCLVLKHTNAKSITKKQCSEEEEKDGVYKEIKQTLIFFLLLFPTPQRHYKIQRPNTYQQG